MRAFVILRSPDDLPIGVAADETSAQIIIREHAADDLSAYALAWPNVPVSDVLYIAYWYAALGYGHSIGYDLHGLTDHARRCCEAAGGDTFTIQRFDVERLI